IELTTGPQARVVLAVHSERGIGSAIITRHVPTWPHELVVRWHLRGLESFELTTAQGRLSGAVTASSPGSPPGAGGPAQPQATARATPAAQVAARLRFRLWRDAHEESLLQPGDPWFAELRVCQPGESSQAPGGRHGPGRKSSAPSGARVGSGVRVPESPVNESPGNDLTGASSAGGGLPLERGYFELTVPAALLAGQPPRLELAWIDFHR
ncbi:MAG: hypothetical protein ACKO3P_05555, partial [Planctomycetaceae bacterium]